ncbi:MAG: AbrB/MazE/SpoVT family DNA-binding domain-containing protein [Bryobacterales bacterium]|nr:AbrB/MazE/SpoVT family DNA-binding domain-containing protein [Bryobacterales bacterium]MDE0621466.1 AbrB/MazE/SpoVT family DNA-binding domain-containing protein [Bryobacterales bacterium]
MEFAKITSSGRATIPKSVREAADLNEGDVITFEVEGDHLVVRKVTPWQDDYVLGLSKILNEWVSPEDEEAWRDL